MKNRCIFNTCLALLAAGLCLTSPARLRAAQKPPRTGSRPNILFIFTDDHAYQAISAYGSRINRTPHIDRLAQEGMLFRNCCVTNSICGPCRAVIQTGLYNHLNGFYRNGLKFDGSQQTFPKLLQQTGYQTAVIGKWHLASTPTGYDYSEVLIGQGPYYNPPMLKNGRRVQHTGYTTDIVTDLALDWLKSKRDTDKPFLLMCQHKAPHRNWQPAARHLSRYDGQNIAEPATLFDDYAGRGTPARTQDMTIAKTLNASDLKLTAPRNLTPEQRRLWDTAYQPKNSAFAAAQLKGRDLIRWKYQRYIKDYLRCIAAVDENIGRVLKYLDESGLAQNTVVVYSSDQGFYLGEHGWFDKRWMYEESLKTPLIVRWPGVTKPGTRNKQLVSNLDFAETFLDIAGAEVPSNMQGHSLVPLLQGHTPGDWRKSFYYHYYEFPAVHSVRRHYGVRTQRHKLIHFYNLDEWELYDLDQDPQELNSVYGQAAYAETTAALKTELQRLRKEFRVPEKDPDAGRVRLKFRDVPPKLIWRLQTRDLAGRSTAPGRKARALKFPGNQPISPEPSRPDCSMKTLTVGGWCKPSGGHGVLIAQGGESQGYSLFLRDGIPTFAVRNGSLVTLKSPETIPIGEWAHVAAVLDHHKQIKLFVNGRQVATRSAQPIGARPFDALSIGGDSGSQVAPYGTPAQFTGLLEDVRLYWGMLPAPELAKWSAR